MVKELFEMFNETVFDNKVIHFIICFYHVYLPPPLPLSLPPFLSLPPSLSLSPLPLFFLSQIIFMQFPADMPITWNKRMKTTAGWCTFEG